MKKKMIKPLLTIVCLLSSISVSAYGDGVVELDGLIFERLGAEIKSCRLIGTTNENGFVGDIVIPDSVYIGGVYGYYYVRYLCSFSGSSEMTGITIPGSIYSYDERELYKGYFHGCTKLERVAIEYSRFDLEIEPERYVYGSKGEGLFRKCPIKTLFIDRNLSYKPDWYYGYSPFAEIETLSDVTFGNNVTEIGAMFFYRCSGLTKVILGKSIKKIGKWAFDYCTALTELYSLNITPPEMDDADSNFKDLYETLNVYVPEEALEAYQNAEGWKNFKHLYAFDPTGIKDVEVDGVKGDGKYYDLRGNKLDAPKRGINIINGKKVVVK